MLGYTLVKEQDLTDLREAYRMMKESEGLVTALLGQARETAQLAEARAIEGRARAEHAERMVQLQAKSIEQLMASNERMVGLVADMRRVGFGILEPIETNETPDTTAKYDREAVEEDPDLEADDD